MHTLWVSPGGNLGPFWNPKMGFMVDFIKFCNSVIWDLRFVLCRSKDIDPGEILVLGIILDFPAVNRPINRSKL